jgi:hypothetical protein
VVKFKVEPFIRHRICHIPHDTFNSIVLLIAQPDPDEHSVNRPSKHTQRPLIGFRAQISPKNIRLRSTAITPCETLAKHHHNNNNIKDIQLWVISCSRKRLGVNRTTSAQIRRESRNWSFSFLKGSLSLSLTLLWCLHHSVPFYLWPSHLNLVQWRADEPCGTAWRTLLFSCLHC